MRGAMGEGERERQKRHIRIGNATNKSVTRRESAPKGNTSSLVSRCNMDGWLVSRFVSLTLVFGTPPLAHEDDEDDEGEDGDDAGGGDGHDDDDVGAAGAQQPDPLDVDLAGGARAHRVVGRAEVGAEGGGAQVEPEGRGEAVDGEAVAAEGAGLVAAALPREVHRRGVGVRHASQQDVVVVLALCHGTAGLVCKCKKSCVIKLSRGSWHIPFTRTLSNRTLQIHKRNKLTYDFHPGDHLSPAVPVLGDAHVVSALVPRDALVEEEEVVGGHDGAIDLPGVAGLRVGLGGAHDALRRRPLLEGDNEVG